MIKKMQKNEEIFKIKHFRLQIICSFMRLLRRRDEGHYFPFPPVNYTYDLTHAV